MKKSTELELDKKIINYVIDYYEYNKRPVVLSIISRRFLKAIRKKKNDKDYDSLSYINEIEPLMTTMRKDGAYIVCHKVVFQYVVTVEGLTIPMEERPFEIQHYTMPGPSERFILGEFNGPSFTDNTRAAIKKMNEEYYAKIEAWE